VQVATNSPRAGQGGRPRTFQDDDFFRATTFVIVDQGYGGLTLEAVARELGCTGTAVSRRFGSKRGLIGAFLEWSLATMEGRFHAERDSHSSPIEALRARSIIPADQRTEELGDPTNPDHHANMAAFWAQMRSDQEFRPLIMRQVRSAETEASNLLLAAREASELHECDPIELGRTLTAAWIGTTQSWPGDGPDGTLVARLGTVFDTIVGPYLVKGTPSK
jgi:AcrR family transcriptional regulator